MMKFKEKSQVDLAVKNRYLTVVVFALFFSWMLAFPYEGRVLYAITDYHGVSALSYVFGAMAANVAGLLGCGFIVRSMKVVKRLVLISITVCTAATGVFFLPPSLAWSIAIYSAALLAGACVAAWGFYFKNCALKENRIRLIADCLISSNLLMIGINMTAIHLSAHTGLGVSMLVLVAAFIFALRLPNRDSAAAVETGEVSPLPGSVNSTARIAGPLAFLCLFIVVITINSGLMFQVVVPAFTGLEWLTSWYWVLPYVVALIIMRNLPRRINRTYILYAAIAMIGFSFIIFLATSNSWVSYLAVNTLLLGACGIFDLFWWSILGSMLDDVKNPATIFGTGLAANVLGVLLGGLIGNVIGAADESVLNHTLLAFAVVFVTLVMLPPLNGRLTKLLREHSYLTALSEMPEQEQARLVDELDITEKLTAAERNVALLLIQGKTYKEISGMLHISGSTVNFHASNIYGKAGVTSKTELANLVLRKQAPE